MVRPKLLIQLQVLAYVRNVQQVVLNANTNQITVHDVMIPKDIFSITLLVSKTIVPLGI